jgi:hypothetical protein
MLAIEISGNIHVVGDKVLFSRVHRYRPLSGWLERSPQQLLKARV